jgi:predicted nucleic acid-binding protein
MLLDTSGLLALLDARESQHQKACDEYSRASVRVTHGFVLAELVAVANARGVTPSLTIEFVMCLIANPDIEKVWPSETHTAQAVALLKARQGQGYSLCDAISFVLMRQKGVRDGLTTDRHFEVEGFRRLLD